MNVKVIEKELMDPLAEISRSQSRSKSNSI